MRNRLFLVKLTEKLGLVDSGTIYKSRTGPWNPTYSESTPHMFLPVNYFIPIT